MILSDAEIKAIKELGSSGPECINDLLDTIVSKDIQISQLQEKLEKCKEALRSVVDECVYKEWGISETTFNAVSEALQAIE